MPLDKEQETNLMCKAQAGDTTAFEALVLYYRPHATRFAGSILHDSWAAEDIAQECFAKVWLNLSNFKAGTSFKSWLFTIIRNRCIDYQRTAKPVVSVPDEWDLPGGEEPESSLEKKELWNDFIKQYNTLAPDAKMALYLFSSEQMPYEEIARVMGKNSIQIKTLLYRTRKKLKHERSGTP